MNKSLWYSVLIFLTALFLTSCSTISRKPVSLANQKSHEFLEQARKEELKRNYTDALSIYSDAESYSILANDIDLQLISLQGIARIAYIKGDSIAYVKTCQTIKKIVDDINPLLYYRVLQLDYWRSFQTGDYARIVDDTPDISGLPLNVRIEMLSYIVQANAKLNKENGIAVSQLERAIKRYYVKLKRKMTIQPELISNAYYSLAFAYASQSRYGEALARLSKAIKLDKGYDLYVQLADDFALAGKCELKRDNPDKAKANLSTALQIYRITNQHDESKDIEALLNDISTRK